MYYTDRSCTTPHDGSWVGSRLSSAVLCLGQWVSVAVTLIDDKRTKLDFFSARSKRSLVLLLRFACLLSVCLSQSVCMFVCARLRWVWRRHPSAGLPIVHALVVTHLCSCVQIGDSNFIPFLHDGRLSRGSCLALKPLVSDQRYASQVIPPRSQYLRPDNHRPSQGYSW